MASGVKDVTIALHPPSLDRCKEVVDAWYPPEGSDDHICGCSEWSFDFVGGFWFGKTESGSSQGFLHEMTYSPPPGLKPNPNYVVEADDWKK